MSRVKEKTKNATMGDSIDEIKKPIDIIEIDDVVEEKLVDAVLDEDDMASDNDESDEIDSDILDSLRDEWES
ncbi:hypothetical protein KGQ27_00195 [Patescibacteria group bacterium]|nr:hypothetical protein [Patescibacteria group bacterium]MDE1946635.1 hypothetical protein [Patescibacteria group bacterium]MDE2010589.1 hypothetical protein [Patescibacteria group bacterium]MDE2233693.1 hypothetical protein [Patescibacteria group bacterium]